MRLSAVYMNVDGQRVVVMRNVSALQACGEGGMATDLLGRSDYVQGRINDLDLVEEHIVLLDKT